MSCCMQNSGENQITEEESLQFQSQANTLHGIVQIQI